MSAYVSTTLPKLVVTATTEKPATTTETSVSATTEIIDIIKDPASTEDTEWKDTTKYPASTDAMSSTTAALPGKDTLKTENTTGNSKKTLSIGEIYQDIGAGSSYEILSKDTVELEGMEKENKRSIQIPKTIVINNNEYQVSSIANGAFKNNKKLVSVSIPKTVKKIGKEAFKGCKNLKKIIFTSKKKVSIGKNAFKNINKKAVFKLAGSKKMRKKMETEIKKKNAKYPKKWHFK